jgi:hypothetical protein
MLYRGKDADGKMSCNFEDHATWNSAIHPPRSIAPIRLQKGWIQHVEETQHLTPSQVIHQYQSKVVESDLSGELKKDLLEQSSGTSNVLRYRREKAKKFEAFKVSDVSKIVTNKYVGKMSLKDSLDDSSPTIFIEMISKKMIKYANKNDGLCLIDGVFKLAPSLQLMILGVPISGYI